MEPVWTNPHKLAGLAYGVLGVFVVFLTFASDLVPSTRDAARWQLVIGAVFVLIFASLIYRRGWWPLSAFLVLSNTWRAINYFGVALGLRVEMRPPSITPVAARPVAFVHAALMALIVLLLARSAWIGFSDWRARRHIERES